MWRVGCVGCVCKICRKSSRIKAKNTTHDQGLTLARQIRAAGIPIGIEEDDEKGRHHEASGLLICQVGGVVESSVADLDGGLTRYIIYVRTTSNLPGRFAISSFELERPWKDPFFHWLDDPVEIGAKRNAYRFPGSKLEFDRSQGINHYADVRGTLSRGQSVQGLLLGVGFKSIPDRTWPENLIPAFLTVFDQFGRKYSALVFLWADRSQRLLRRTRTKTPRRALFDSPDWEPSHVPLPKNGCPVKR
jgi:hypothetical protein